MGRAVVELYCSSFRQVPRLIVQDIDNIFEALHGGQQLRLFNAYHDEYGFQPIAAHCEAWSPPMVQHHSYRPLPDLRRKPARRLLRHCPILSTVHASSAVQCCQIELRVVGRDWP
jgi:hypothetical protein